MRFSPHEYQRRAIRWVEDHPRCLLFLDMGLGKTVSTLTAIQNLICHGEVDRVLVIAPKKIAESTWSTEAAKWDHLFLRVSAVTGDPRHRVAALGREADIYVIGRDSVTWLADHLGGKVPFDMVVLDELTSFKNHRSLRFKALRKLLATVGRVVGLTGTPTPNGLPDLWAQVYCVDNGERLGKFITRYRQRWFNVFERNNIIMRITPKKGAEEEIRDLLSDIALTMKSEDYLSLPEMMEHDITVTLPDKILKGYRSFEEEQVIETLAEAGGDSHQITAGSAAALSGKLSQYANGAIYDDERNVGEIHGEKLDALGEILEAEETPVLCFYQFQHDRDRIMERFSAMKPRVYAGEQDLNDWNAGKIRLLLAHPASTAFGLNMQHGGNRIVWFSTGWNLELYQQANARLHRQGQTKPVMVYRLIASGTIDERMSAAITEKAAGQDGFLNLMKRYVRERGGGDGKG